MSSNRKIIAGIITAAALAASGSLVYAQADKAGGGGYQGSGRGESHGMRGHERGEGHRGHGRWSNPAAAVEGHLAALKVELKITPNQEQAWQTFATKTRQQAEARSAQRTKMMADRKARGDKPAANVPAPERLAQRTARMKQFVASMEARTAAVTELYAVLSPEQKAIADKQFARGHKGGHRWGNRGHRGDSRGAQRS
jgi:periplasmic protein CpxP/Spy